MLPRVRASMCQAGCVSQRRARLRYVGLCTRFGRQNLSLAMFLFPL